MRLFRNVSLATLIVLVVLVVGEYGRGAYDHRCRTVLINLCTRRQAKTPVTPLRGGMMAAAMSSCYRLPHVKARFSLKIGLLLVGMFFKSFTMPLSVAVRISLQKNKVIGASS